jgi:hypothetical protein
MSKKFSSIAMKRKGAAKLQKKLNGMSLGEELNFWKDRTQKLKNTQERLIKNARAHRKTKRRTKKTV